MIWSKIRKYMSDKVIDFIVQGFFVVMNDRNKFFELLLIFLLNGRCAWVNCCHYFIIEIKPHIK